MNPAFSLESFKPLLETYRPPEVRPAKEGTSQFKYDLLSFSITVRKVGEVLLEAKTEGAANRIEIKVTRPAGDGHGHYSGFHFEMENGWARVASWTARTWLASEAAPDVAFPRTKLTVTGQYDGNRVRLESAGRRREIPLKGPLASKWTLLETVRRLMPDARTGDHSEFSCLDEYETILPDHSMQIGEWSETPGGAEMRPVLQLGAGSLPRVFWIDRDGCVRCVAHGLEGLILTGVDDSAGSYTDDPYDIRKIKLSPDLKP